MTDSLKAAANKAARNEKKTAHLRAMMDRYTGQFRAWGNRDVPAVAREVHGAMDDLLERDRRAIAASLLVAFLYGSTVWGVLPIEPGVSWQTHLAAALIGLALAIALRHLDIPPRKRYEWEGEAGETREPDDGDSR